MALNYGKLLLLDQKAKLLVSGYVNEMNNILKSDKTIIPSEIADIITLFTFQMDHFKKVDKLLETVDNGNIASVLSSQTGWSTAHGIMDIECNKYPSAIIKWRFNVQINDASIGLDSDISRCYQGYAFSPTDYGDDRCFYALGNTGCLEYKYKYRVYNFGDHEKHIRNFKKGDELEMIFNIAKRTLKFKHNGNDYGNAYKNIDITRSYHCAVSLRTGDIDDYVELLDCDILVSTE